LETGDLYLDTVTNYLYVFERDVDGGGNPIPGAGFWHPTGALPTLSGSGNPTTVIGTSTNPNTSIPLNTGDLYFDITNGTENIYFFERDFDSFGAPILTSGTWHATKVPTIFSGEYFPDQITDPLAPGYVGTGNKPGTNIPLVTGDIYVYTKDGEERMYFFERELDGTGAPVLTNGTWHLSGPSLTMSGAGNPTFSIGTGVHPKTGDPLRNGDLYFETGNNKLYYFVRGASPSVGFWKLVDTSGVISGAALPSSTPGISSRPAPDSSISLENGDLYFCTAYNTLYVFEKDPADANLNKWHMVSKPQALFGEGLPLAIVGQANNPNTGELLETGDLYFDTTLGAEAGYFFKRNLDGGGNPIPNQGSWYKIESTKATPTVFGTVLGVTNPGGTDFNTGLGYNALVLVSSGQRNVAVGEESLASLISGTSNVAVGANAGTSLVGAVENTFLGNKSGELLVEGQYNVFLGSKSGGALAAPGNENTAIGSYALASSVGNGSSPNISCSNVALGYKALYNDTASSANTIVGAKAGENAIGSNNIYVGYKSGVDVTGGGNVIVGSFREVAASGFDNYLVLSYGSGSFDPNTESAGPASKLALIANDFGAWGLWDGAVPGDGIIKRSSVAYGDPGDLLQSGGAGSPPSWKKPVALIYVGVTPPPLPLDTQLWKNTNVAWDRTLYYDASAAATPPSQGSGWKPLDTHNFITEFRPELDPLTATVPGDPTTMTEYTDQYIYEGDTWTNLSEYPVTMSVRIADAGGGFTWVRIG
jgi:hypothetical protein